jgi:hypothetical protein
MKEVMVASCGGFVPYVGRGQRGLCEHSERSA